MRNASLLCMLTLTVSLERAVAAESPAFDKVGVPYLTL